MPEQTSGPSPSYAAPQPGSRIIAIEPFPPTFARLQATVTANRLSNVQCVNAALGAEEGLAYMGTIDEPSQFRAVTESGEQAVRVTTLQTIFDQNNVDEVDLLKIDIEGGDINRCLPLTFRPSAEFAASPSSLTLAQRIFSITCRRYSHASSTALTGMGME